MEGADCLLWLWSGDPLSPVFVDARACGILSSVSFDKGFVFLTASDKPWVEKTKALTGEDVAFVDWPEDVGQDTYGALIVAVEEKVGRAVAKAARYARVAFGRVSLSLVI